MTKSRNNWLWYFFILIGTGAVLSFSFIGKFNPHNQSQPKADTIRLLRPEQGCNPVTKPCAASTQDIALVVRLYPISTGFRLLVKTLGIGFATHPEIEASWLNRNGAPSGRTVFLQPAKQGGFMGDMDKEDAAKGLRLSFIYQGQLMVADIPL